MFDFLILPRELRDLVYRHALVAPGKLPIAGTYGLAICPCCKVDKRKSADTWDRHKRGCHLCQKADCAKCKGPFYEIESEPWGTRNYDFGKPVWRPNVALLLTCRDILLEAVPVLYGENDFAFQYTDFSRRRRYRHGICVSIDGEDTAACFFQDRSLEMLQLIRTVSLLPTDLDCQDLHMRELCFDFMSRHMKLRTLAMHMSYFRVDVRSLPWQRIYPESMELSDLFPMPISRKLAKSIRAFCRVTTLESLVLTIRMDYKDTIILALPTLQKEDMRAAAAFVRLLKSRMIKHQQSSQGHKAEGPLVFTATAEEQSEIWHLHCGESASKLGKLLRSTAGTQVPSTHTNNEDEEMAEEELMCPVCLNSMRVTTAGGVKGRRLGPMRFIDEPELQAAAIADWPENLGEAEFLEHVGAIEDGEGLEVSLSDAYESEIEEDTDDEETGEDEGGWSSEDDETAHKEDSNAASEASGSGSEELSGDIVS